MGLEYSLELDTVEYVLDMLSRHHKSFPPWKILLDQPINIPIIWVPAAPPNILVKFILYIWIFC